MEDEDVVRHTLRKPIEHAGKTYQDLTFREPTAGDMMTAEKLPGGSMSQSIVTLALMADVPLPAFQKITARELNKILDKCAALMGNDEEGTTGEQ